MFFGFFLSILDDDTFVGLLSLFLLYHKTDSYVFEKFIYVIRETEI